MPQPTGGVILLIDTQPEEEKVLIEEKLKKAPIEKAAAPTTLEDIRNESFNLRRQADAQGEASGSGAAAAAGVLTAVDEDGEGDEEAPEPHEFEYFTDREDEE
jgi:26S proteasome regulatory subunit N2